MRPRPNVMPYSSPDIRHPPPQRQAWPANTSAPAVIPRARRKS